MKTYTTADFDFDLPPELIAQHPAAERTGSRLLDGRSGQIADRRFTDLPKLLQAGDLIVFNDTQVVKARLFGRKASGGKLELLVERVLADKNAAGAENRIIAAHMKVSKKPSVGSVLQMDGGYSATLLGRWPDADGAIFRLELSADAYALMAAHGHVPLPPYIAHADDAEDERRYQTVFAQNPGAVAAPTASLHFDEATLQTLADKGVEQAFVTLHVGAGTFQPVKGDNLAEHVMHYERYHLPPATIAAIARTRARGGRIIAVGTTTVRTLESWAKTGQTQGDTNIFITPGFAWQVVDGLLTNFHLPRSTLMMLVSALAGHGHIMALYQHAVAQRYRFFSYGDCMLLGR
ncbi:MAG: tRNA preQ1(34) S-adenosylmethionine ribosyltransferase-isomerase QueA [Brachymonas sp.]|jgi:S-adenosylmethionine:tRNA ribosyltransferase-isomerase